MTANSNTTQSNVAPPGMRVFTTIWVGQMVSQIGSALSAFGLGVWLYTKTGSVLQFTMVLLASRLPAILLAPLAGSIADRWERRLVMILSDSGAALTTLAMVALLFINRLELWHIYVFVAIGASFRTFQSPAYMAATTLLVSEDDYGRASGMAQLSEALSEMIAPLLAGLLIVTVQLQGVLLIDFATFLVALLTLILVRFPKPKASEEGKAAQESLWTEATYGWTYIATRPGMVGLLMFFATINFVAGFINALIVPLVLNFTNAAVLGTIMTVSGVGILAGSVVLSAWGGPKRRILGVVGFTFLLGIFLSMFGLLANAIFVGVAAFLALFCVPIVNGCSQAIWQSKVPPDIQGRVFSTQRMIAMAAMPLAYLLAGPLADQVFEPLLAPNGALASSIGQIIGVGPGRGIALMFILSGLLIALIAVGGYLSPRVRLIEDELPTVEVKAETEAA